MSGGGGTAGLSWLFILLVVVVAALGVGVAVTASRRRRDEQARQERLARAADSTHEGAKTRHEGGP